MTTLHSYMTYGGFVGIFSEWHPFLFRLLQIAFPDGGQGLEYLSRFTRQSIDEIGRERNSFADKKDCEEESLLHSMFAMHQNDPNGFSLEDITYHMIPNVLAGAETVSISLSAAFYYLCKDIEVMNRLRRELDEKRETGRISVPITFKESQDCNYLQAVVKEVLRLHPALGHGLPRVMPKGGMTLAGQFFPEKASFQRLQFTSSPPPQFEPDHPCLDFGRRQLLGSSRQSRSLRTRRRCVSSRSLASGRPLRFQNGAIQFLGE